MDLCSQESREGGKENRDGCLIDRLEFQEKGVNPRAGERLGRLKDGNDNLVRRRDIDDFWGTENLVDDVVHVVGEVGRVGKDGLLQPADEGQVHVVEVAHV